jgi:two-component system, LytTR family, sensor kinase
VPLEREIDTLERYLDIMRQRFEDKLTVDLRIDSDVRGALVPHLLLQPLVENSIKHGADPESHAVNATLTARRDGQRMSVGIRDRGRGLAGGPLRRGTGLTNTAERLAQLYGPEHAFAFEDCARASESPP